MHINIFNIINQLSLIDGESSRCGNVIQYYACLSERTGWWIA